jgi:tryptophan halogenase
MTLFPNRKFSQAEVDQFNRISTWEYECIRDFLILHYHATKRDDTPFWNYCRTMPIPESLQRRSALFQSQGRVICEAGDLFVEGGWIQVMYGQGLRP